MEQVLNDDTVSRLDAIKAIRNIMAQYVPFLDGINQEIPSACGIALRSIPSVDRPQGWIPCGERMPEYLKTVLISTFWGVKTGFLDSTEAYGDFWEIIENDATAALYYVYAWMPLPEPWKGANDETTT